MASERHFKATGRWKAVKSPLPADSSAYPGEVESGSPTKDMRQTWNLRRFPLIWDHLVIPNEWKTL
jgi:hypothetical protein